MKRDEWHQKNHDKNLKTLIELVKRIVGGIFYIINVRIDKETIAKDQYRVTMYLKERDE